MYIIIMNYSTDEVNGTISQEAWSRVPAGTLTIEFYISDVGGNLGYAAVEIIKEIPEQPLIHGYNFLLIFPILLLSIPILAALEAIVYGIEILTIHLNLTNDFNILSFILIGCFWLMIVVVLVYQTYVEVDEINRKLYRVEV